MNAWLKMPPEKTSKKALTKTEKEILNDYASETPPDWFKEKVETELKMTPSPSALQTAWDEWRKEQGTAAKAEFEDEDITNPFATP